MKTEPIIYCKAKAREKSIVMAAVEQDNNTVAICLKNSHSIITKKQFDRDYLVVDKPAEGLSYVPHVLRPREKAEVKSEAKPEAKPVAPFTPTPKPSTKDK